MTNKLLTSYLGKSDENDRDHYGKKRVDTSGKLLLSIFRQKFINNYLNNAKKIIQKIFTEGKEFSDTRIDRVFDSKYISDPIRISMSIGNWGTIGGI